MGAEAEVGMFVGHFGVGLAAKKLAPRVSLGTFLLSVQLADLLWPVLLLLGVEHVRIVPLDEGERARSLRLPGEPQPRGACRLGDRVRSGVLFLRGDRAAALLLAAVVLSHWLLDFTMHRPDMPILPRGPYVGLGLWKSLPATLAMEGVLYAAGIWIYLRTTAAKDDRHLRPLDPSRSACRYLACEPFWSAAPDEKTLAWSGMIAWLLVPWAYWIDRHWIVRLPN